jgi:hypothetical protein
MKLLKCAPCRLAFALGWFAAQVIIPSAAPCAAGVNPGVVEITSPGDYQQVVAVSDAHGMYKPLLTLLRSGKIIDKVNNWSAGKTLLIVVGDSINKGPDSVDIIDLWMSLYEQAPRSGGRIIHLLGNHEAEFLADPKENDKATEFRDELRSKGYKVKEFGKPGYPRGDFLLAMPVAARVGKWLFCHAGLLPDNTWEHFTDKAAKVIQSGDYSAKFLLGEESVLESKDWWDSGEGRKNLKKRLSDTGLFGVVFGHQNKALDAEGRNAISGDRRLIKIDNGMSPDGGSNPGSLLVFPHPTELLSAAPANVQTIPSGGTAKPLRP